MIVFLAHLLIILAAWTLVIKFAFPVAMAIAGGAPVGQHIYWDFWWVIHLWLAWCLLNWRSYTFALALVVAVVETVIVVTKFVIFLDAPEWTIWTTNWFINKIFVLACFVLMLGWFTVHRERLRGARLSARAPPSAAG